MRTLLLLAALLLACSPAQAAERILRFHSDIEISADGSIEVTETIRVRAEGERIRRGIFRDFPTLYAQPKGGYYRTGFDLLEVLRNGRPESWRTEPLGNGVRVYIGDAGRMLKKGEHSYSIRYRSQGQLGSYAEYDELYWNVTGNGWEFAIDKASARVRLPRKVAKKDVRVEAYTGAQDAQGGDWKARIGDRGEGLFETTRKLQQGEGLTLVMFWPKGITPDGLAYRKKMQEREAAQREQEAAARKAEEEALARRMAAAAPVSRGVSLLALLGVLAYYVMAWRLFGRDPEPRAVYPRYQPPAGYSPAELRYYLRGFIYDAKCLSSDLLQLTVRQAARLTLLAPGGKPVGWELDHLKEPAADAPQTERELHSDLFDGGCRSSVRLLGEQSPLLQSVSRAQEKRLARRFDKTFYCQNLAAIWGGYVATLAGLVAAMHSSVAQQVFNQGYSSRMILFGIAMGIGHWLSGRWTITARGWALHAHLASAALLLRGFCLLAAAATLVAVLAWTDQYVYDLLVSLCAVSMLAINAVGARLLDAYTPAGRALMEEIFGFRLYLGVAEKTELQRDLQMPDAGAPPEMTQQHYSALMPYAMALDVEEAWTRRFSAQLGAALRPVQEQEASYDLVKGISLLTQVTRAASRPPEPVRIAQAAPARTPARSLFGSGSSKGFFTSSSRSAPGSSSGAFGRGRSGGGGGGGGGGGW